MNNLKTIRELYGITQDEIATAINVNRTTISIWENNEEKKASNSNLERLSLYYGIGPEFFYDKELDETARQIIIENAQNQRTLEQNKPSRHKVDEFHDMLSKINFDEAIRRYMVSMKIFLATLDEGSLEKLENALIINEKMGARLKMAIDLKKQEKENNEESLSKLLDNFTTED